MEIKMIAPLLNVASSQLLHYKVARQPYCGIIYRENVDFLLDPIRTFNLHNIKETVTNYVNIMTGCEKLSYTGISMIKIKLMYITSKACYMYVSYKIWRCTTQTSLKSMHSDIELQCNFRLFIQLTLHKQQLLYICICLAFDDWMIGVVLVTVMITC